MANAQSSAHHDASPPAKRVEQSGGKAVSVGDHGTQTKCAPTIKLPEAGNALAGMLAQPSRNEVYLRVKVRIQHSECRQTLHTPQEAVERTLCSWRISEDAVSTDSELGMPS